MYYDTTLPYLNVIPVANHNRWCSEMIDPIFSTAISAALFASATIPVLLSKRRRSARQYPQSAKAEARLVDEKVVNAMIRYGRAYALEAGDSTMIIVVLENRQPAASDIEIVNDLEVPVSVRIEGSVEASA